MAAIDRGRHGMAGQALPASDPRARTGIRDRVSPCARGAGASRRGVALAARRRGHDRAGRPGVRSLATTRSALPEVPGVLRAVPGRHGALVDDAGRHAAARADRQQRLAAPRWRQPWDAPHCGARRRLGCGLGRACARTRHRPGRVAGARRGMALAFDRQPPRRPVPVLPQGCRGQVVRRPGPDPAAARARIRHRAVGPVAGIRRWAATVDAGDARPALLRSPAGWVSPPPSPRSYLPTRPASSSDASPATHASLPSCP